MLGYESERRLKNFLIAVGEGEIENERLRQRLCDIRDFAPSSAFQRIDRDANNTISSHELINYLRDNGVYSVSETEINKLVKFFDSDEDGRLSLQDFIQIVLPCEDNALRRVTQDRYAVRVGRYDNLPIDIERGLADVIQQELSF